MPHNEWRRLPAVVSRVLLCAVACSVLGALAASACTREPEPDSPSTWAVVPATEDGPDGRSTLEYTVGPDDRIEDAVAVRNFGERELTLDLYAQDASQAVESSFAVAAPEETPFGVGAWLRLTELTVTVPPRGFVVVPVVLDVPRDAEPGDHAGAVLAVSVVDQDGGPSVSYATGTRVYVRVAGPVAPALSAELVSGRYHGRLGPVSSGSLDVSTTLVNTGNVRLEPTTVVRVRSLFGLWTRTFPLEDVGEILPDGAVATTGSIDGVPPLGPYWLTVETTEVTSRDQDVTTIVVLTSPTVVVWAVPWVLLGALVLLALAAVLARRIRRRRLGPDRPRPDEDDTVNSDEAAPSSTTDSPDDVPERSR